MKSFVVTLVAIVTIATVAIAEPPSGPESKPASTDKVVISKKESNPPKDSTKTEKSFKETMRFLLLRFEKK